MPSASENERPSTKSLRDVAEALRDVNERLLISSVREHESAEASERGRGQLSALLEALSEGVIIADEGGRILMVNDAARKILKLAADDPQMADILALDVRSLGDRRLADHQRPLQLALRGAGVGDLELLLVGIDGEVRHLVTSATSIAADDAADDGHMALAIVVFRDVTEIRRLERQREEYLALISHDLRSPLTAILLLSQVVKSVADDERVSPRVRGLIERVESNAKRVNSMINELLDATNLEHRGDATKRVPCDVAQLIRDWVGSLEDQRRSRVVIEFGSDAPCVLEIAPAPVERAFSNLVTNALKYSSGAVRLRLERRGNQAVIEVLDDGPGIAPDHMQRLFDRYYQVPGTRRAGGLGLGLYIARLIVEAEGGHVEVRSELGVGSTFSLVFPMPPPHEAPVQAF